MTVGAPADPAAPAEGAGCTRWQWADGQRTGISSFELAGLHCAACADVIEGALRRCDGVVEAQVSAAALRATVRWDPDRTSVLSLLDAIHAAGYRAAPDGGDQAARMRASEHRAVLWRLFVCAFLAMQVMMLATPSYVAGPEDLSPDMRQLLNWGSWVLSLPVVAFGAGPFVAGAWRSMRSARLGMDVPIALGILVAFGASSASTFDPSGPFGSEVYFDSLTMFLAFLWGARYVELRLRHRAAQALLASARSLAPMALRVQADGSVMSLPIENLRPGDRLRIPAGGAVPADGPLLTGPAELDESMLSGESRPVLRRIGEDVLAGSLNAGPPFEMRAQRLGADTRQEAIVALMRESLAQRPASSRLADRWAGPFLWVVLATSALAALVWWWIEPSRALGVAVAVLVVTCPCALSLATPATVAAATSGLARRGVLLRRLQALEALAELKHLFVDKTGTLTEEHLRLQRVQPSAGKDAAAMTQVAASLARWSSHPVSRALVQSLESEPAAALAQGAGASSLPTGEVWQQVQEQAGRGLCASDQHGHPWRLGAAAWALTTADTASREPLLPDDAVHGLTWVVLSRDGVEQARFGLSERLRDDAQQAVSALRSMGLRMTLLSGDSMQRSQAIAAQLQIDEVHAAATPEAKFAALEQARCNADGTGAVGMLGDGLNDAPVMARADVSLAMGHGALAARMGADGVIAASRLSAVVDAVATGRRAMRIIRQNLGWALAYNALCIPLAALGVLTPWLAGLGMAASSLIVILNSQRAARGAGHA